MSVRRVIVDHVLFVVADVAASRRLYTAALAPLGYEELYVQQDCVSYGAEDLDDFTICQGEPVTTAAHVAFSAEGREDVDAFESCRLQELGNEMRTEMTRCAGNDDRHVSVPGEGHTSSSRTRR